MTLTSRTLETARAAGASAVGVTDVAPFAEARAAMDKSAETGMAGPLGFTYNDIETATDIRRSVPWARSIVVFGVSYMERARPPASTGPVIGRFATGDHYEAVRAVAEAVSETLSVSGARVEVMIDDNRLVDRSAAVRAGVGWLGRSTMVLTPGHGPWMLLGSVVTDADLEKTEPMKRGCGTCTACIPACPTGALDGGALDARRCLSTWLQTGGAIPFWIRPILGRRIYGCDDCLTSCPPGHPSMRASEGDPETHSFSRMLGSTDQDLLETHTWWYVPRREGRFIRRNLVVAAGNSGEETAQPALIEHLAHPSSLIRGHASWAVARALGPRGADHIARALEPERDPDAREEMLLALLQIQAPPLWEELMRLDEVVATDGRRSALGVAGIDIDSGELPSTGIEPVLVDPHSDLDSPILATVLRINDRERRLERLRRRARA